MKKKYSKEKVLKELRSFLDLDEDDLDEEEFYNNIKDSTADDEYVAMKFMTPIELIEKVKNSQ